MIQSLPLDVQARIITDFDPRGDTRDVSAKCSSFARTVAQAHSGSAHSPTPVASSRGASIFPPRNMAQLQSSHYPLSYKPALRNPSSWSQHPPGVDDFLHRWGLTADRE